MSDPVDRRKKGHPFELNGGRGWIMTLGLFLLVQTGAAMFWAGQVTQSVETIQETLCDMKNNIPPQWFKEIVMENKRDIKLILDKVK